MQVEALNKRLPWLKYEQHKAEYRKLQEEEETQHAALEEKKRLLAKQKESLKFVPPPHPHDVIALSAQAALAVSTGGKSRQRRLCCAGPGHCCPRPICQRASTRAPTSQKVHVQGVRHSRS